MSSAKEAPSGKVKIGRTADRPYWMVVVSIIIRAFHQVGAAVFLTLFLMNSSPTIPFFYIALASVTGIILICTEGLRHRQLLREVSGVVTVAKLFILGLVYHGLLPAVPSVLFVFLAASFFSHAPKNIRHRLLL
jgi:hypothetical protein